MNAGKMFTILSLLFLANISIILCFSIPEIRNSKSFLLSKQNSSPEYDNIITTVLDNFLSRKTQNKIVDSIIWDAPKRKKLNYASVIKILKSELPKREWFVSGNVDPTIFSDLFEFKDPDVKLKGIENYARGVNRLFNQEKSRAQIINIDFNKEDELITITWRLSGVVNIGLGLNIKPYIVYTDYR
jgi:hypothetical protein